MAEAAEKIISVPEEAPVAATLGEPIAEQAQQKTRSSPAVEAAADEAAEIIRQQQAAKDAELARLRNANAELERRAREAEARAGQSEATTKNTMVAQISSAIDARTGALSLEKAAFKAAWEAGDSEKLAEIQVRMSTISAELLNLNSAKAQAEWEAKSPPQIQRSAPINEVEAFIQQTSLPNKSATWLREHPDALSRRARLARAHEEALEDGHGFETPGYFETIERIMGIQSKKANGSSDGQDGAIEEWPVQQREQPRRDLQQTQQRRAPAAPPSSSAGSQGSKARQVTLTAEMRKAAEISGITEEEYAANYLKAKAQGLIN
jgi:hypothetical protein